MEERKHLAARSRHLREIINSACDLARIGLVELPLQVVGLSSLLAAVALLSLSTAVGSTRGAARGTALSKMQIAFCQVGPLNLPFGQANADVWQSPCVVHYCFVRTVSKRKNRGIMKIHFQ